MSISSARETVLTQLATNNSISPTGSEIMSKVGRSSGGEQVQMSTSSADITDALEELGMAASSRAKVDINKVKVRKGAGTDLDALGRIAEYYDKLPNLPKDQQLRDTVAKFQKFEEAFRRGEERRDPKDVAQDIKDLLAQYDGDLSHQFAALETIRDMAVRSGAPEAYLAVLDSVRQEMRRPDFARDIVAGFASATEAHRMEEQGIDPQQYRDGYRQLIRETPSMGSIFRNLMSFSTSETIGDVIDSFIKTAGTDMSSFGPSTDPVQLGEILDELKKLKLARTVLDGSQMMLDKLERLSSPVGV